MGGQDEEVCAVQREIREAQIKNYSQFSVFTTLKEFWKGVQLGPWNTGNYVVRGYKERWSVAHRKEEIEVLGKMYLLVWMIMK